MHAQKKCRPFEFNLFGNLLRPACPKPMAVVAPALLENPRDGWKSVRALTQNFVNFLGDIFGQSHNVLGPQITLICAGLWL